MSRTQIDTGTDLILAEKTGPVGWIIFNNPARLNAMKLKSWQAMGETAERYANDPEVRVVVLKGAGDRAFVSGADISEFEEHRSTPEKVEAYEDIADGAQGLLLSIGKPTIAMIRGYCIGGGVGIALCCDMRIATHESQLGIPAAKLGLGYRVSGVNKLINVVGPAYAKEIFFTAKRYSAAEALQMGLINWAVADDELDSFVDSYCQAIARNAPMTMQAVKAAVDGLGKPGTHVNIDKYNNMVKDCFGSEDYAEGRKAFMEKRSPVFQGR